MTTVKKPKHKIKPRLTPISPEIKELLKFFKNPYDFILKEKDKNWYTVSKYPLQPRTFEKHWFDRKKILGIRHHTLTNYGCLDIDRHSPYHPANNKKLYRRLKKALKKIGIHHTVLIRSSDSEGIHLFFFLPTEVNSFDLACALRRTLKKSKLEIKSGQLEIFPNTKGYSKDKKKPKLFNGLRVPLQPGTGACLLNPQTFKPIRGGIKRFVELMNLSTTQQNIKLLQKQLNTAREWWYTQGGGNKNEWEADIKDRLTKGFTGSGQTNELLMNLANLGRVFLGYDTVESLGQFIYESFISLPGYEEHCNHKHEPKKRSFEWASSAINKGYWTKWRSYPKNRQETFSEMMSRHEELLSSQKIFRGKWSRVNQKRRDDGIHRLQAIVHIHPLHTLPKSVLKRRDFLNEICQEMFGCQFSRNTLKKPEYRVLWHPKYTGESNQPKTTKQPGYSIELAVNCLKAIATNLVTNIQRQIERIEYNTEEQQFEKEVNQTIQETIAPPVCNTPSTPQKQISQTSTATKSQQNDRTLMKGLWGAAPALVYRTIELVERLLAKLVEIEKQKTSLPRFNSAEEKMNLIDSMVEQMHRFTWKETSGAIRLENHKLPQARVIKQNAIVKVLAEYHSSAFDDNPNRQLLIYIQPAAGAEDWQSGIAVPIEQLEPIESPVQSIAPESNNIDNQNLSYGDEGDFLTLLSDIRRFLGLSDEISDNFAIP